MSLLRKDIPVSELRPDWKNPRLRNQVSSDDEAFRAFLEDKEMRGWILELAKTILERGLDVGLLPIVISDNEQGSSGFIALDANRRLTAIRVIQNPSMLTQSPNDKRKIEMWKEKMGTKNVPSEVLCAFASSREEADPWIELRHSGAQGGAGSIAWRVYEAENHRERKGLPRRYGIALDAISVLRLGSKLNNKGNITTLDRVLKNREIRNLLGYKVANQKIHFSAVGADTREAITKIAEGIIAGKIKVSDVKRTEEAVSFIKGWLLENYPRLSQLLKQSAPVKANTTKKKSLVKKPKQKTKHEITLAASDFNPEILPRYNKSGLIRDEIKQIIPKDLPVASVSLLRIFLEVTTSYYLTKVCGLSHIESGTKKVRPISECGISTLLKELEGQIKGDKDFSPDERKSLSGIASKGSASPISATSLNQYMHSRHAFPDANVLRSEFEGLHDLLMKMWAKISEK